METHTERGILRVTLSGELKSDDAVAFTEELHGPVSSAGAKVAIDLTDVALMDSAGLSAIINAVTRARLSHAEVILVNPSAFVRGVFDVTHLDGWFDIMPDMASAIARLSG